MLSNFCFNVWASNSLDIGQKCLFLDLLTLNCDLTSHWAGSQLPQNQSIISQFLRDFFIFFQKADHFCKIQTFWRKRRPYLCCFFQLGPITDPGPLNRTHLWALLSRNNCLWKGARPERLPRRVRRGSKIFWMMEKLREAEGRNRQEKAAARFLSNEPSRDKTKKLMKTSKGLVYDGPVQVLIDLVEKPGIMCYSREQLLKKC